MKRKTLSRGVGEIRDSERSGGLKDGNRRDDRAPRCDKITDRRAAGSISSRPAAIGAVVSSPARIARKKQPTQAVPRKQKCGRRGGEGPYDPHPLARRGRDDVRAPLFPRPSDSRSSNRNFIRASRDIQLRLHYLEC